MGKAEQRCGQASSVAILRQKNLSRTICRGEQCLPVLRICCKFRIVGVRWDNFVSISKCCYRGFVSSTGERCSPLHIHRADTARLSNNTSPKNRTYTQIQKILIKKPLQLKINVI